MTASPRAWRDQGNDLENAMHMQAVAWAPTSDRRTTPRSSAGRQAVRERSCHRQRASASLVPPAWSPRARPRHRSPLIADTENSEEKLAGWERRSAVRRRVRRAHRRIAARCLGTYEKPHRGLFNCSEMIRISTLAVRSFCSIRTGT